MNRNLLIIGSGGHGHFVRETAASMQIFDRIDNIDDLESEKRNIVFYNYRGLLSEYSSAFVAYSNNYQRHERIDSLIEQGFIIPVLVHPTAYVSPSAVVMDGTIIGAMARIHSDVRIERGCVISLSSEIGHGAVIRAGSHIDIGTSIRPNQVVGTAIDEEYNKAYKRELSFF